MCRSGFFHYNFIAGGRERFTTSDEPPKTGVGGVGLVSALELRVEGGNKESGRENAEKSGLGSTAWSRNSTVA